MADFFGHQTFPNGMKVLWDRSDQSRVVSLGFFFPFGSKNDPVNREGMAHFVEHFLFKGTKDYDSSSLARVVEKVGGDLNAYTDRDEIAFTCTLPSVHWQLGLHILSEICFYPTFPESELEKEREVVRSEILASHEDGEERAYERFWEYLSPKHSESHPIAGTSHSLDRITLEDLKNWAQTFLIPDYCTISWAGAIDENEFLLSVAKLGERRKSANNCNLSSSLVPQSFFKTDSTPFQMVQIVLGFHQKRENTIFQFLFLQCLSLIWAENMSSRLFQTLREEEGLCYNVSSQFVETGLNVGIHTFISTSLENLKKLLDLLGLEVKKLVSGPISEKEWVDSLGAFQGGLILSDERMENRVQRLVREYKLWNRFYTLDELMKLSKELDYLEHWKKFALNIKNEGFSLLISGKGCRSFTYSLESWI